MKTFDLPNTLVSELTTVEAEDLKDYLMTCRLSVRVKFILQILDNEGYDDSKMKKRGLMIDINRKESILNSLGKSNINCKNIESEIEILKDEYSKISPSACEVFLADYRFNKERNLILNDLGLDRLSESEWRDMENNYIKKRRREKLIKINNTLE